MAKDSTVRPLLGKSKLALRFLVAVLAVVAGEQSSASSQLCRDVFTAGPSVSAAWKNLDSKIQTSFLRWPESHDNLPHKRLTLEAWALSPHGEDLKSKFGFRFEVSSARELVKESIHVPSIGEMMGRYDSFLDRKIAAGQIAKDDVIRPVFLFKHSDGERRAYSYGEKVPDDAVLDHGVMSGFEFLKLLAEGKMPMGNEALTPTDIPTFQHDLAHLAGFMASPEYMAAVRGYAKGRVAQKLARGKGSAPTRGSASLGYAFIEGLVFVKPGNGAQVRRSLDLPETLRAAPELATVAQIEAHLRNKSSEELQTLYRRLSSLIDSNILIETLGGAGREPMSSKLNSVHQPLLSLKRGIMSIEDFPEEAALGLAKLQLGILRLSSIRMEDWVQALRTGRSTPALDAFYLDRTLWGGIELDTFNEIFGGSR